METTTETQAPVNDCYATERAQAALFASCAPGHEILCPNRDAEGWHYDGCEDGCEDGYRPCDCSGLPAVAFDAASRLALCGPCAAHAMALDGTPEHVAAVRLTRDTFAAIYGDDAGVSAGGGGGALMTIREAVEECRRKANREGEVR